MQNPNRKRCNGKRDLLIVRRFTASLTMADGSERTITAYGPTASQAEINELVGRLDAVRCVVRSEQR
jgi:hypothetical protein